MRHESLFFLFSPVTRIKGVGASMSASLQRLLPMSTVIDGSSLPLIRDLLFHLPVAIVDRRHTFPLNQLPKEPTVATFTVKVDEHIPPAGNKRFGKKPYRVICSNETGSIVLVFFSPRESYITGALPLNSKRIISGRVEPRDGMLQMAHPDIITTVDKLAEVQKPEAVYPLTVGLTSRRIGKIVADAMEKLPRFPEWLDEKLLAEKKWPHWKDALQSAHHPQDIKELESTSPPRTRLAYDEMLANQLHLAQLRSHMQQQAGEIIKGTGKLTEPLLKNLPFKLTTGQQQVLNDISEDMASGKRMGRLLQGDVGSGKTVVALLAMLKAVEQGLQAALMVPTEIIAAQHFETLSKLTQGLGIKTVLLTGAIKGNARKEILSAIASGEAHLIVGTHALFQEHVNFHKLALIVIDEQHRFGVNQRMALTEKGNSPHLLHMTATPIPRSLTMTLYGDMESSNLKEKPIGRQPITTRVIPLSRYQEIMERLKAALDRGEKVYWICPLIEHKISEGEFELTPEMDLAAAETRFTEFKARFGDIVGLVHGKMKADMRNTAMHDFASGKTRLLVATTVIEVGVDVKDATIIVIEKAERFGLSQLHQLRGRVGRGDKASACVLLYSDRIKQPTEFGTEDILNPAVERLSILRESEDGFKIAEVDLAMRGGGELLGIRQSGRERFIFTDLFHHQPLLEAARQEAKKLLDADPELKKERGPALKLLLQLFGYE